MSGICGIFSPKKPELAGQATLAKMLATLEHPGDRGRNIFLDESAGLAIGQVQSRGFQTAGEAGPSTWLADQAIVAGIDGSVYADDAEAKAGAGSGVIGSHASRVAAAYETDMRDFPAGLNGYFSLVLWDRRRRELVVASDRQGMKPFYYYFDQASQLFVFGSQIKAVVAHPAVPRAVDPEGLAVYLRIGYPLPPTTLFKDVRAATAAQMVRIDSRRKPRLENFWNPEPVRVGSDQIEDWRELVHEQVVATVARITGGGKDVGVLLSGGVESAVLLAALKECGVTANSFTVSFDGADEDDQAGAAESARQVASLHHAVRVEPREISAEVLSEVFRQFDGVQDSTGRGLAHYFVSQAAAEAGIYSCLSGTSGERIFGTLFTWEQYIERGGADGEDPDDELLAGLYIDETKAMTARQQRRVLREPVDADAEIGRQLRLLRQRTGSSRTFDILNCQFSLRVGSGPIIFPTEAVPRLHGVEVRNGFLDAELFRFGRSIPLTLRAASAGNIDRRLLRHAFAHQMPHLLRETPRGAMPGLPWNRPGGFSKMEPLILRLIAELRTNQLFQSKKIDALLARFETKREPHIAQRLYLLFSFKVWHDFYIERTDRFADLPNGW